MNALRIYEAGELRPDGYPHAWHRCPTCAGNGWLCAATGLPADGRCCGTTWRCPSYDGCPDCFVAGSDHGGSGSVKQMVRDLAGNRCVRCGHPYRVGRDGIMEPVTLDGVRLARDLHMAPRAVDLGFELAADGDGTLDGLAADAPVHRRHWSPCDEKCTHRGPYRYRHGPGDEWVVTSEDEDWIGEAGLGATVGLEVQALWRILTVHHLDGDKANCRWWNLAALCQRCHLTVQGKVQMARVWPWEHSEWFRPYVAGYYASVYLGEELTRAQVDARLDELLSLERVA